MALLHFGRPWLLPSLNNVPHQLRPPVNETCINLNKTGSRFAHGKGIS